LGRNVKEVTLRRFISIVLLLFGPAVLHADTRVFDFSRFNPDEWDLVNVAKADVRADGLHLIVKGGAGRVGLVSAKHASDGRGAATE
jgi:hypothetical protein